FSDEFWRSENWLSLDRDQCACIRVIAGNPEPQDKKFITAGGSFCCQDTIEFVSGLNEQEKARFRGVCVETGFATVAIIPITHKNRITSAIHLADKRKNMAPGSLMEFIESLTILIGQGIDKFNMQDSIQKNYITQGIVNSLLRLSLQKVGLEELLNRVLNTLFSVKMLSFVQAGVIFLTEDDPGYLLLKAQKGLPKYLEKACKKVAFGKCICGQSALTGKIKFVEEVNDDHEIECKGMGPHGHYCVPVIFGNKTLGVINFYLRGGYRRDLQNEEFLFSIANALAGIILRKQTEERLNITNKDLQIEVAERRRVENELQKLNQELEQRVAERTVQLQLERDKVQKYLDVAAVIMLVIDTEGRVALINKRGCAILGYSEDEIIGKNWFDTFIPENSRRMTKDAFKKLISRDTDWVEYFENSIITKNKEERLIAWHNTVLTNQDASVYAALSSGEDITERKKAEDALKLSYAELEGRVAQRTAELARANAELHLDIEKRKQIEANLKKSQATLSAAQRIAHLGNWDWDIPNNELTWSDEVYRIFGVSRENFGATYDSFLGFVHPDDREMVKAAVGQALREWKKYSIDHRIIVADGTERIVHEEADLILDENGKVVRMIGTVHDITERKHAEEELMRVQKELLTAKRLSDIGALAATVAHELRNPLGVIRTAIYNVRRKTLNPLLDRHFENIEKKITESDIIINNLLFYSRLKSPHFEQAPVCEIIDECVESAKTRFNKLNVSIKKKFEFDRKELIECDPHQIGELFNNILSNCYEALPGRKGKIEIKLSKLPGNKIRISFKDNGVGIEEENLKRIFEPFFTTKTRGTGLGLPVCQQIVSLHNGNIEIDSVKGKGTTFTVFLPASRSLF
ncbi:MAG: PAS domain-containing protein, partial [Candidatus Omnitrophica bacterium]|nr:PAS domain-containing protein [Candidatus Omnitrophota bacterium]